MRRLREIDPFPTGFGQVRATLETNHGHVVVNLFHKRAPKTVANFVGLAEGTIPWKNAQGYEEEGKPYYDGLVFHRVIPGFMIQGGCNLGTGTGGPGYCFADEFHRELRHGKAGMLSMANAGPNTNGGQFFITLGPTPHLDDRHAIFGEVVSGMECVTAIGNLARDYRDTPQEAAVIQRLSIEKIPG